ncbi:MAG: YgaP-like transmembrane domain [Patescibacteria group bacterium]
MIKNNLGKLDRILRFALAFWWLGPWAPDYPYAWADWGIFVIGWIALVEAFLGWCWIHDALGVDNKGQ